MYFTNSRHFSRLLMLFLLLMFKEDAQALNILITDGSSTPMTTEQLAAIESGAAYWENRFDDDMVVNIIFSFEQLGDNKLGSTRIARTTHPFSSVRAALVTDATPGDELNAVVQLDPLALEVVDVNGPRSATFITMSTANAKALGLGTGLNALYSNPPIGIDAEITFDSDSIDTFDFDRSDGITDDFADFVGVAAHEIGHALGFSSQADLQDDNPLLVISPSGLDIWRWPETGSAHTLSLGPRLFKADPAEWYDSVLNNVPLSHGTEVWDAVCEKQPVRNCQASHWSDDQAYLMDPTVTRGVQTNPNNEDYHALDYIGYDANIVTVPFDSINDGHVQWWNGTDPIPMHDPYPIAPWPQGSVPSWANMAWVVFIDSDDLGKRSAAGYVRFTPQSDNVPNLINPSEFTLHHTNLNPPGPPAAFLPAALQDMTLLSDNEHGVQFRFLARCAESGCQYDPTLGAHGGYRVPGSLDGSADNTQDIDATAVWIVLADENLIPDAHAGNVFSLDTDSPETGIRIYDRQAFGLPPLPDADTDGYADAHDNCLVVANVDQRDTDHDGIGNMCDGDRNNDCVVNFLDIISFKNDFFSSDPDSDFDGNGIVNFLDFLLLRPQLFGSPGPSGVANICGSF